MKEFSLDGIHYRLVEHPSHPQLVRMTPGGVSVFVASFSANYDPAEVLETAVLDRVMVKSVVGSIACVGTP